MNRKIVYICILFFLVIFIASCNFITGKVLGVKLKTNIEQNPRDVISFYKDFSQLSPCKIYSFSTLDDFIFFNDIYKNKLGGNYPSIFIENIVSKDLLKVFCFDDIKYNVDSINNDTYSELNSNDTILFNTIKKTLVENCEILDSTEVELQGQWKVYLVYGQFMGKYIRKKFLVLTEILDISELNIIDLSIVKK